MNLRSLFRPACSLIPNPYSLLLLIAVFSLTACRSAYVETTIENTGPAPLHLIEVDYPSASFGMQSLDAHAIYHYRFKIQGSGPVTLTFNDAAGKPHTAAGPTLKEGQQGNLHITIGPSANVGWGADLSSGK
jgi:hypothetical protein